MPIPKTRLSSVLTFPSSYPGRLASRNSTRLDSTRLDSTRLLLFYIAERFFITNCTDPAENTASIIKEACLLIRCLTMDALFLRALARAGMCLPRCCLAMGIYVTILTCRHKLLTSVCKTAVLCS
jgi:hypothetical protein